MTHTLETTKAQVTIQLLHSLYVNQMQDQRRDRPERKTSQDEEGHENNADT